MADISINISLSASVPYHGQNASTQILFGTLDNAHNSTLSGYWINYPTPWPYLLISVAISIGLGWLGFRSSAKSWHPVHKKSNLRPLLRSGDSGDAAMTKGQDDGPLSSEATPQPQIYAAAKGPGFFSGMIEWNQRLKHMNKEERRAFLANRNNNPAVDAERAAQAEYVDQGQQFDPQDDISPDGGMGKFAMYKAIFGIAWTTLRSISIFALAIKVASGSGSSNSAYPGPLSVMILFTSAQTYLSGRGMPRLFNTILAYDLVLIWIAFVMCSFGHNSTVKYYGKIGVQGGNCPYFDRSKYLSGHQCASGRWDTVGCATNSTWDTNAHEYPRGAWWFTGNPDPNTYGNSLLTLQLDFKLIGIVYGLFVLFCSFPFFFLPFAPRELRKPLPAIKFAFLRRMSYTMSLASFGLVLILSAIAIPVHISTELSPPVFPYVDSHGPLVNTLVFNGDNAETAIDGQWPSLAWNQSHTGGTEMSSHFLGGNESSWSDCFWVQAPRSTTGHLSAWWEVAEAKALRVMAGI